MAKSKLETGTLRVVFMLGKKFSSEPMIMKKDFTLDDTKRYISSLYDLDISYIVIQRLNKFGSWRIIAYSDDNGSTWERNALDCAYCEEAMEEK